MFVTFSEASGSNVADNLDGVYLGLFIPYPESPYYEDIKMIDWNL